MAEAKTSAKEEGQREKAAVTMADDTWTDALMMMTAMAKAEAKTRPLQKSGWTEAKTREGQKKLRAHLQLSGWRRALLRPNSNG